MGTTVSSGKLAGDGLIVIVPGQPEGTLFLEVPDEVAFIVATRLNSFRPRLEPVG
jgi:hypothetical protein